MEINLKELTDEELSELLTKVKGEQEDRLLASEFRDEEFMKNRKGE